MRPGSVTGNDRPRLYGSCLCRPTGQGNVPGVGTISIGSCRVPGLGENSGPQAGHGPLVFGQL
jgi:hypothetical protein